MSRISLFNSPLLLGFEEVERALDRVSKVSGDGFPPYNIERVTHEKEGELLRITLAVAGFDKEELEITVEDRQLFIKGQQSDAIQKEYLHRGIAARQFKRSFVLADGMEVVRADLQNGLLSIDLVKPDTQNMIRKIEINK